nr:hypothetical protein [Kribbella qitaiheensis]
MSRLLIDASTCGVMAAAAAPCTTRGRQQYADGRCERADQRQHGEAGQPDHEQALAAEPVAEATTDDEQGGIGDAVAADDQLELAGTGVQVHGDRGQSDVDDEEGEHRQEGAEEQRGQRHRAQRRRCRGLSGGAVGEDLVCHRNQLAADSSRVVRAWLSWYWQHPAPVWETQPSARRMER